MEKMNQPRCGVPDNMMGEDARKRRFAAQARWSRMSLTWRIDNVTPDFGAPADIVQVMREALKVCLPYFNTNVTNTILMILVLSHKYKQIDDLEIISWENTNMILE